MTQPSRPPGWCLFWLSVFAMVAVAGCGVLALMGMQLVSYWTSR